METQQFGHALEVPFSKEHLEGYRAGLLASELLSPTDVSSPVPLPVVTLQEVYELLLLIAERLDVAIPDRKEGSV